MEACCTLGMLSDRPGAAAEGGGAHGVQPQPRHQPREVRRDHHHPHLRGPPADAAAACARPASASAAAGSSGMGESVEDRCELLRTLAAQEPHPESVPINMLVAVHGHAARRRAAGRDAGHGARDRDRAHPHAARDGAPLRGAAADERGGAAPLHAGRARTASSSGRSCSPPGTRRTRRTWRCFEAAGIPPLEPRP